MKILRTIGIAGVIVAGVLTLGLGYYGFVPGLSAALGSAKPRDLKVDVMPQDLASAQAKAGVGFVRLAAGLPPDRSLAFAGETAVRADFTARELTALLRADDWRYGIVDDAQVRIGDDGDTEISGLLRLDRFYGYAEARHVDTAALRPYLRALESFTHHPAFYVKLRPSWTGGRLELGVQKAEIGRYEIEPEVIAKRRAAIDAAVQAHLLGIPGFSVSNLTFGGGTMHFEGTCPKSVSWSP